MIIDCIADLHGYFPELQGGDLLIVAGDLTNGNPEELVAFSEWIAQQKYEKIVIIAGNHDSLLVGLEHYCFTEPHISYLCDSGIEFKGLKIWGSPFCLLMEGLEPDASAFMLPEKELSNKYSLIPSDVDILVTHGPRYGVLDKNSHGESCGSVHLSDAIDRIKPKLHVFGHIHASYGKILCKHIGSNTLCVNASLQDVNFDPVNPPIRIDVGKGPILLFF